MNATGQDEITAYVEGIRAGLAGLPEATREELLEDLPEHLAEVQADGTGTLTERLGSPEAYASELRATAGFVGGFPDPPPGRLAPLQGRLVVAARLFDQDGSPIQMGDGYPVYCTDPRTGDDSQSHSLGYPYCPQNAPLATDSKDRHRPRPRHV